MLLAQTTKLDRKKKKKSPWCRWETVHEISKTWRWRQLSVPNWWTYLAPLSQPKQQQVLRQETNEGGWVKVSSRSRWRPMNSDDEWRQAWLITLAWGWLGYFFFKVKKKRSFYLNVMLPLLTKSSSHFFMLCFSCKVAHEVLWEQSVCLILLLISHTLSLSII